MTVHIPIKLSLDGLDQMMPMCLVLNAKGIVIHAGPTFSKLLPGQQVEGTSVFRLVELRRPKVITSMDQVRGLEGSKLYMRLRDEFDTPLIGTLTCLPGGKQVLLNMSFGYSVVDAVRRYDLAGSDFAPTDLTLEMLYLVEAKSAAMETSNQMAQRLYGEKTEAEAEAMSDELTGLKNRRALDQVLTRLLSQKAQFALMHLDLDFFKAVNDTMGHLAGDQVLQNVAGILTSETREADTVARVGGDEFILILTEQIDHKSLSLIAKRMIERLEEPVLFRGEECRISASIGMVTTAEYDQPDAAQMIDDADVALYASKDRGRACYTIYTSQLRGA
ncbi:diguanylate cyclase domain-containing protein [Aliiroseovarius crassostreae]|uniref:diguanylate cyclase domain-containing protein n=1 Tax=Aliiroseovarius crassostreae TaxID=154981 RepID=UPI003C7AB4D9